MKRFGLLILLITSVIIFWSCTEKEIETLTAESEKSDCTNSTELNEDCDGCPSAQSNEVTLTGQSSIAEKPLITFVELGSDNCIPCKKMQPVMKAVEKKYGEQIKVIFYDVWKADQKKYAKEYDIRLIPTQVFLDKNGMEVFRHEGFFPESEIDKFLQKHGLIPKKKI